MVKSLNVEERNRRQRESVSYLGTLHQEWVVAKAQAEVELRRLVEDRVEQQRTQLLEKIMLEVSNGVKVTRIAEVLGVNRQTIYRWIGDYTGSARGTLQHHIAVATADKRYELVDAGVFNGSWTSYRYLVRDTESGYEEWVSPGAATDSWHWGPKLSTVRNNIPLEVLALRPVNEVAAFEAASSHNKAMWVKFRGNPPAGYSEPKKATLSVVPAAPVESEPSGFDWDA